MKTVLINGSPRKNGNTAKLIKKAEEGAISAGADTKIINLYDLNFKGCASCFGCKRIGGHQGECGIKDELSDVLLEIMESDVLILGTPIYMSNIKAEVQALIERLLFMNFSYDNFGSTFTGKIQTGLIYTMGMTEELIQKSIVNGIIETHKYTFKALNGEVMTVISNDAYQFDDYSKYHAKMFDEKKKLKVLNEQFPRDCQNAFDMGKQLVENCK